MNISGYAQMIMDMFVTRDMLETKHKELFTSILVLMEEATKRAYMESKEAGSKESNQ